MDGFILQEKNSEMCQFYKLTRLVLEFKDTSKNRKIVI